MPRIARIIAPGLPHHITQRGNYRQDVFLDDGDRLRYLSWIQEYSTKFGLKIFAYCLMRNHVHFIAAPAQAQSLSKVFNVAHMRYAQYFNKKTGKKGHLWQGRFNSCILGETHLISAARYIERNPVRAGLVQKPWQWQWSSAAANTGRNNNGPVTLGTLSVLTGKQPGAWENFIDSAEDLRFLRVIRKQTSIGRPLGTDAFLKNIGNQLRRNLCAPRIGRPKKQVAVPI